MSYGKVYAGFWTDEKIVDAPDDAKLAALYFLTGPHRNMIGCMRVPIEYLMGDLKWPIDRAAVALSHLCSNGYLVRDERTGWTLIVNQLKYDGLGNDKHAKAAARLAMEVPRSSSVFAAMREKLMPHLDRLLTGKTDVVGYPIDTPSAPVTKAKPSPEPEPEPEPEPVEEEVRAPATAAEPVSEMPDIPPALDRRARPPPRLAQADALLSRIVEIVQPHAASRPGWMVAGEVMRWLEAGADPEADVIPTIRRVVAERTGKPGWPPKSAAYFTQAVADAVAARKRPMPEGASHVPGPRTRKPSAHETLVAASAELVGDQHRPLRE